MIVLGFDQSSSATGFAYGAPGTIPTRELWEAPDYGNNTARLGFAVMDWAAALIKSSGAQAIFYEQVIPPWQGDKGTAEFEKQVCVYLAIEFAAASCGLADNVFKVEINAWRKEFYRGERPPKKANASMTEAWKDKAMAECLSRGWLCDNHNIAEACGVWHFGCCYVDARYRASNKRAARKAELDRWNGE